MAARRSLGSDAASVASGAGATVSAAAACSAAGVSCSLAGSVAGSGSPNGNEGCTTPPGSLASGLGSPSNLPRRRRAGFSASRAASAAASRAFSATNAAAEVSSCTVACVRVGAATSPACITMTPQVLVATNSTILGSVKPVTSLTIEAPQRTAALATATWRVSIETMAPSLASARTTGSTRRASSSGLTGVNPGRVDSPPTSMMSAPASSIARPYSMAASGSKCSPPSLNESGVTLRTPMMRGRSKLSSYFPHRHVLLSFAMNILLKCPRRRAWGAGGGVVLQSVFLLYPRARARTQTQPRCRKKSAGRHLHPDRWEQDCKWPAYRR